MNESTISGIAVLSWAAGTFEGEGTVTITRSGKRGYTRPIVMLTSTDSMMVSVFQKRWPGQVRCWQPKGNARKAYTWTMNVRKSIARFLWDILPFLRTDRVRHKAMLVLEDIGARVQGAKGPEYISACHARREQIRELNKRGVSEHALPMIEAAYASKKVVPLLPGW
jgi:hypothetical protein